MSDIQLHEKQSEVIRDLFVDVIVVTLLLMLVEALESLILQQQPL